LVYAVHNLVNKFYVGQTTQSLHDRWRQHRKPCIARRHGIFPKAVQKYGKDNFDVQCVSVASNKKQLDNLEKLWVILLRSSDHLFGYNRTFGGDGSLTEDARQLMKGPCPQTSLKLKGRKRPQYVLDILRAANIGRPHSTDWCLQHSLDMTGRRASQETKKKMSEARKRFWDKKLNRSSV
jgi:group I intron endonuclease